MARKKLSSIPENRQQECQSNSDDDLEKENNEDSDGNTNGRDDDDSDEETHNHNEDETLSSSVLWSGANAGWTLTWPIWHLLPHHERHSLAKQYGYKSIGEFEEYMSLQQAMGDSTLSDLTTKKSSGGVGGGGGSGTSNVNEIMLKSSSVQKEYPSDQAYLYLHEKKLATPLEVFDGTNEDDDDASESEIDQPKNLSTVDETGLTVDELMAVGGKILVLPSELLHRVFSFLPVDTYGTLALVSPHWKHLTRTESVYKRLCERLYLNQSKRRQLHVSRFGGSYRRMLEIRPRVKVAGGCYVLKYAQIKQVQRDMWTEVPIGAILETIYYRYFYFQEDGLVLYALTSAPPHEMFRRLLRMVIHKGSTDKAAVWGDFVVQKHNCTVTAKQEHTSVMFNLTIQPQSSFGRFAALTLDNHFSSVSGNFADWSEDRVEYKVPSEVFRFVRDPRL